MKRYIAMLAVGALFLTTVLPREAWACPFCAAVSQTFSQEMESMDAVVIAKLTKLPPPIDPNLPADQGTDTAKATFTVVQALKGADLANPKTPVETLYFGEGAVGKEFLIMAVKETPESRRLQWTTPLLLSERGKEYVQTLPKLPKESVERLKFFLTYLEDADETLAREAYDEFANAPYDDVKKLKESMDHDQLLKWIKNADIPASRRRLYLTLLGVCGTKDDVPLLEEMLKSGDRNSKAGLDALIACYLTLKGTEGVALVEDLYLANAKSEYADTYSAIMALRFHGTEGGVIPKERVVKAVRHMLKRPQLADLVIPDLARWEDWGAMDELVTLFKTADEKNSWVRVPVINYLRACPLPAAKQHLADLEKIDPAAVKRANMFFPAGGDAAPAAGDKASDTTTVPAASKIAVTPLPKAEKSSVVNSVTLACVPGLIGLALWLRPGRKRGKE
jgi:hypothetical protein